MNKEEKQEKEEKKEQPNPQEKECNCGHEKKHCLHHGKKDECLNQELESAKKTILELQNKLMYTQADAINYRKRKDEEVANYLKFANQDLVTDLLAVLGNLDHAMAIVPETEKEKKIQDGIQMISTQFQDILKKYGVVEIEALGYPFDSNYMEAMMVGHDPEKPDDMVLEVLMKGYKYKERVIKPAVVKVNKIEANEEKQEIEKDKKGNE